jgi:hypothetical protein
MSIPMFAEKEKNGVSAPHPPPGGMLTHDGNYGARSGGGTKSIIGGLQTSCEPQFAQQSGHGRKHPSEFKLQCVLAEYTLGFDRKGSRNLTLWDSILCQTLSKF